MKIRSYIAGQEWLEENVAGGGADGQDGEDRPDPARQEIDRVLSDIVRSKNLVVLTGLGTSLCVKDGEDYKAPTMGALWDAVRGAYEPEEEDRASWAEILEIARHPSDGDKNIEILLSRCKMAESFETGDSRDKISQFIADAERIIREKVDFLAADEQLPLHESFLRRLARRSTRRERLKLFTTNYDRCFEHAAQRSGFVIWPPFHRTPKRFRFWS